MIKRCLFSRKELIEIIKKSPITNDGYYFCPRFKIIINQEGKIDDGKYFYDRSYFKNYMCFNKEDLDFFTAKKKTKKDIELLMFIQNKLNEVLKGYEFLHLKDKIPNEDYTLEELIDTTIYVIKYKQHNN